MRTALTELGVPVDPAAFTKVCEGSHEAVAAVDLLRRGELVDDGGRIPVSAGTVTVDRRAAHRTRASGVQFPVPPGGVPTTGGDLAPGGLELRIWRGVVPPGTTSPWWVPLGTLPIWTSTVDANGVVTVDAWDRSKLVSKYTLRTPYAFTTAFTLEEWVNDLIAVRTLPWLGAGDFAGALHPGYAIVHERGSDPWKIAVDTAAAVGYEIYFDGTGRIHWQPEPDLATADPVRTVSETNVLVDATAVLDREPSYNAVRVVAANPSTGGEWVGYAEDLDPASSTFVGGDFGYQVLEVRDELATSQADVDAAARARLVANRGIARSVSHDSVPNPLVEPGDAELVIRGPMGLSEIMLVEAQTIGLGAESVQRHDTRTRQI